MPNLIVALTLMSISIIVMVSAFLISVRIATIVNITAVGKNRLILSSSIALLSSGFFAYTYALIAVSEVFVERTIAITVFLVVSINVLLGTKIIHTASKEIRQLKEEANMYLKCIEENSSDKIDSINETLPNSQTGLYDKQYLHRKLDEEITRALRQKVPLYLIVFDIDQEETPKNILQIVGNIITNNIRDKIDTGFHYDDKKFAITLPYTTRDQAITIAKRILYELNSWSIRASIGLVSCIETGAQTSTELIKIAAIAVGEAKIEGGNRIRLLEKSAFDQTEHIPHKRSKIKHLKLLK